MIIEHCDQGSDEWLALRLGNPGASKFHEIVKTDGKRSLSRDKYLYRLASELYTGFPVISYKNERMNEGNEKEEESRAYYEMVNSVDVAQVGLFWKDEQKKYHCSPDGHLPNERIGFETKDAEEHVQIARLMKRNADPKQWTQCQGSLLISEYEAWDYQSYCSIRPELPVLTIRVYPDDKFLYKLEAELNSFCLELALVVKKLKEMN